MKHKDCGGDIEEDWSKRYEYDTDDDHIERHPALRCKKCGEEVIGDSQIENDPDAISE